MVLQAKVEDQVPQATRLVVAEVTIRLRNSDQMSRSHRSRWGRNAFDMDLID